MLPRTETDVISVVVLDDHSLFRRGLVRLLEGEPDIRVTADCATTEEAIQHLAAHRTDILLLDYDLGGERGFESILAVKARHIETRILVVTAGVTDHQAAEMVQQGIAGIFLKADPPELLVQAIRKVGAGEVWLTQEHVRILVHGLNEKPHPEPKHFSVREKAVLRAVVEGLANKQIAAELQTSESSVKAALQQLFAKTGVRTRSQLVRIALERYRDIVT
jgi:two-component system nitrate/nitrite response regulator NarL